MCIEYDYQGNWIKRGASRNNIIDFTIAEKGYYFIYESEGGIEKSVPRITV